MEGAGAQGNPVKDLRVYIVVWLVLVGSAVFEAVAIIEGITASPLLFVVSISIFQAALIALFFQYLRSENSIIKLMTLSGGLLVAALIIAGVTSVLTCTPYFPTS